jgi:hypothetical protein
MPIMLRVPTPEALKLVISTPQSSATPIAIS